MRKYGAKLLLFAHLFVKVCKKVRLLVGCVVCLLFFFVESSEVRLFEQKYGFGGKCMVGIRSAGKTNLVLPARILHTAPL